VAARAAVAGGVAGAGGVARRAAGIRGVGVATHPLFLGAGRAGVTVVPATVVVVPVALAAVTGARVAGSPIGVGSAACVGPAGSVATGASVASVAAPTSGPAAAPMAVVVLVLADRPFVSLTGGLSMTSVVL